MKPPDAIATVTVKFKGKIAKVSLWFWLMGRYLSGRGGLLF